MRTGLGIDTHRFAEGRKLILGGVEIPHTHGLDGHSDADVLAHAITDAILGAASMGDIGTHFPDTDPEFKDADSLELLREVVRRVGRRGWRVEHVDATVMLERPKLFPYRERIMERLSDAVGGSVHVKATTGERMGFVGREEGVAALAVATLTLTSHTSPHIEPMGPVWTPELGPESLTRLNTGGKVAFARLYRGRNTCVGRGGSGRAYRALLAVVPAGADARRAIPPPQQYFGFELGTSGKLARFEKITQYLKLIGDNSTRADYQVLGKTVLGKDFPLMHISSPANLQRVDQILAANDRLANPRGLSDEAAKALAADHIPVYYLEAGMHSTEVGPVQVIPDIVYRLATEKFAGDQPDPQRDADRAGAGGQPGRLAPRHRLLQRDRGHELHPHVSRPLPLHRPRRQPRLAVLHAAGVQAADRRLPQVQAGRRAHPAPGRLDQPAHVGAAVQRRRVSRA